jgi:hypothetical protein
MAERCSNDPIDFPKWTPLDKNELTKERNELLQLIMWDSEHIGLDSKLIDFDASRMNSMVDMVKKRKLYFHIFHSLQMSELNEICLYVFWILKFRPFTYKKNPVQDINLTIAIKLFSHGLFYTAECLSERRIYVKDNNYIFTAQSFKHIEHAFKYQDLSKEAIMLLAEAMLGDH